MEQVIEKIDDKKTEFKVVKKKKSFKILGISIWRIFAYFVVYSVIGYAIETLFGIARYGMLESRKSFLYGPFCAIYGVGAVIMILSLQYFKKNHNTLFIGGVIVGLYNRVFSKLDRRNNLACKMVGLFWNAT